MTNGLLTGVKHHDIAFDGNAKWARLNGLYARAISRSIDINCAAAAAARPKTTL